MEEVELIRGIKAVNKALWIPEKKIMVIGDVHIGYEGALNKKGILVPRTQFKEMKNQISELLDCLKPKAVIINGDLKHEFGEISRQEWHDTSEFLDLILKNSKVVLIKGNHDTMLEPIAKKKNLEIRDYYCFDDVCITHGHKIRIEDDFHKAKTIIISNEHPAVSVRDGLRTETYKCFLLGEWKRKNLIVLPSFNSITEGSDVRREERLSPYLQQDISNFQVFILGDRIYKFGKLKDI